MRDAMYLPKEADTVSRAKNSDKEIGRAGGKSAQRVAGSTRTPSEGGGPETLKVSNKISLERFGGFGGLRGWRPPKLRTLDDETRGNPRLEQGKETSSGAEKGKGERGSYSASRNWEIGKLHSSLNLHTSICRQCGRSGLQVDDDDRLMNNSLRRYINGRLDIVSPIKCGLMLDA